MRVEQETKLRVPIHTLSEHCLFWTGFVQPVPDGLVRERVASRWHF